MAGNEIEPIDDGDSNSIEAYRQKFATSLNKAAKSLSFSTHSKRHIYNLAGIRPQFKDRLFAALLGLNVIVFLIIPTILASIYIVLIESNEYESEVRFVVRSAQSAVPGKKGTKPSAKIVQDTQVITSYIFSSAMLTDIEKQINVRKLFTRDHIDFLSRLNPDATREELFDYWKEMITASINENSGIVTVKARAFSQEDAQFLLSNILKLSENRVNQLNSGIWSELIRASEKEFEQAQTSLGQARLAIQKKQIGSGVFSVDLSAVTTEKLMKTLQEDLLTLENQLNILSSGRDATSPLARDLQRSIASKQQQLAKLRTQLAGNTAGANSLSDISSELSHLELEKKLAEARFAESLRELKRVKLLGSVQMVYLDRFMGPTLPQDEAGMGTFWSLIASLASIIALWGALTSGLVFARNWFDK